MSTTPHQIAVTIHSQDLLLDYEAANKFAGQSPVTYLFVGMGAVDKLAGLGNVIIARDLPDNIENMKFLVDFTSWYACVQNNLLEDGLVSLIQYDVSIQSDFSEVSQRALAGNLDGILGYSPVEMRNRNFIRDNMGFAPLRDACRTVYGIDVKAVLNTFMKHGPDPMWPATNNVAMHTDTLRDFVRWFTPLAHAMGNEKPVGHSFERAIKLFAVLTARTTTYDTSVLSHFQLNSHGTQDFEKPTGVLQKLITRNQKSDD